MGVLKESVQCFGFGAEIKKSGVYRESQWNMQYAMVGCIYVCKGCLFSIFIYKMFAISIHR